MTEPFVPPTEEEAELAYHWICVNLEVIIEMSRRPEVDREGILDALVGIGDAVRSIALPQRDPWIWEELRDLTPSEREVLIRRARTVHATH